jgi:hypothetical protein
MRIRYGGGTDPRRVVEVENPSGEAGHPEAHEGGALETAIGSILVDVSENAGKDIWACDFVPVVTLFFQTIHTFVIVHYESRGEWCTSEGTASDRRVDHTTVARRDTI